LDLSGPTGGEAALAAIAEASLPSIKIFEEESHFGGADEVGLNDLPDLRGEIGEPAAIPSIQLTDTPLEEIEKMVNGGKKEEVSTGGGDGVRSIKMVEG
jgi:hypothetical protein